jgi:hypothetical protein
VRSERQAPAWAALVVGLVGLALAYANGGYGLSARTILAIGVWWGIILCVGLGVVPRQLPSRTALVAGGLLAAFAAWTLASTLWAPSAEQAFVEFDRATLYLGLYVAAACLAGRRNLTWWIDGLAMAIGGTAVVALASRLFPGLFSTRGVAQFLPSASTRLSFPVGYWNGLAMLAGLAIPLCLAIAVARRRAMARALAVGAVPLLASVVYLASSRGGVVVAFIGTIVFLAATTERWHALGAIVAAGVGSAVALAAIASNAAIANGPLTGATASHQGRIVAVVILVAALVAVAVAGGVARFWSGRATPSPAAGRALVGAVVILAILAVGLSHPVRRFDAFKQPLSAGNVAASNFATAHLLSGNGSGRWQFWSAALDEWKNAPLAGKGAGSYQYWWAEHASFTYFLKNAHSLGLEVLAELGLIGFLLLAGAFGVGIAGAVRLVRRFEGSDRIHAAGLTAVLVAFLVGANIDWMWQLTVVGAVGVVSLGLIAGSGGDPHATLDPGPPRRSRLAVGLAGLLVAWAVICAQAIPWLTAAKVSDSQAAVRGGNLERARKDAEDARSLQPWAATPYLQLALVAERQGDIASATRWIHAARTRDSKDWSVWYVEGRIEDESGQKAQAKRSYSMAKALNPRSPLFAASP